MATPGQEVPAAAAKVDRARAVPDPRGGDAGEGRRRSPSSTRPSTSPCGWASIPRHADQVVRGTVVLPHGTGKSVRVLVITQGERVQGGRGRRRRFRRHRVHPEAQGRLARVRRHRRHAGRHGPARPARPGARPPRPDAEPEGRHGHAWTWPRRSGRSRPARSSSGSTRPATCTPRSARCRSRRTQLAENLQRLHGHHRPGQAVGGQGHLHPLGDDLEHHGAGRPARYGGVPMSKTERQETVESLTRAAQGLAQRLRDRLQRPQRAADDRVPPPAPRRGRRATSW